MIDIYKNKNAAFGGRAKRRKKMVRRDFDEIVRLGCEDAASRTDFGGKEADAIVEYRTDCWEIGLLSNSLTHWNFKF